MNTADFAALLAELPGPVAACLARCRVAALGRLRARMRHLPAERLSAIAAESCKAIALAKLYRSAPVDAAGIELERGENDRAGTVLLAWSARGRSPHWPAIPESMDVRVYRYQEREIFVEMHFGIADARRSQIGRHRFAAGPDDAERTARRWAACARAVLAVRPYLPEPVEACDDAA